MKFVDDDDDDDDDIVVADFVDFIYDFIQAYFDFSLPSVLWAKRV